MNRECIPCPVGYHPFNCRKVAHGLKTMIAEIKVRGCDEGAPAQ